VSFSLGISKLSRDYSLLEVKVAYKSILKYTFCFPFKLSEFILLRSKRLRVIKRLNVANL